MENQHIKEDERQEETVSGVALDDPRESSAEKMQQKNKKSFPLAYIIAALIVILIFGALYISKQGSGFFGSSGDTDSSYPDRVAVVNGETIPGEEFEVLVSQTQAAAAQQGFDLNDPEVLAAVEDQALTLLVNTKLLIQAAQDAGVTIDDDKIDGQIELLESQYGSSEELLAEVERIGLSGSELREDIREQLMVEEYVRNSDAYLEIEVTDKEIEDVYDQLVLNGQNMPALEEVSGQIRAELNVQKGQEVTRVLIDELRNEADIELLI